MRLLNFIKNFFGRLSPRPQCPCVESFQCGGEDFNDGEKYFDGDRLCAGAHPVFPEVATIRRDWRFLRTCKKCGAARTISGYDEFIVGQMP